MSSEDSGLLNGNQSGLGEGADGPASVFVCLFVCLFVLFLFLFYHGSCSLGHNEMAISDIWQSRGLTQLAAVPVPK